MRIRWKRTKKKRKKAKDATSRRKERILNRSVRNAIILLVVLLAFYGFGNYFTQKSLMSGSGNYSYSYEKMASDIEKDKVDSVEIVQNSQVPTGSAIVELKDGEKKTFHVSDVNEVIQLVKDKNVDYQIDDVKSPSTGNWISVILPWVILAAVVMFMFGMMNRAGSNGSGNKMMNFGKSRARMQDPNAQNIRFNQVAGLQEEKEELQEIVDFLKNPQKYIEVGARIPKGVLLVGPPGTGKTLLAKAVSGEAGVPFFSISGSDFVEMFVGVGASRVRDLFEEAKKNAPCIIFIDEIDAVARRRGTGLGGGHDEREQTLNQLLVEMDGFGVNEGIIIMAATNRVDILDPAILRPGRFDRKVAVGRPDVRGREEILKVHIKGKPLAEDVDLHQIARTTPGFSGADLENLMNEAAIHAAKNNAHFIRMEDIRKSFIKVGIGTEKKSRLIPEMEKKITAYHEAGHAILFHLLPDVGPVYTVSIIPTGVGAAGYTMPLPENDNVFETKGRMIQDIKVGMGGRIAEELIFSDVTTGASQDIKQVTETARNMITKYGMSEKLGFINYEENSDEVFLGRDLGHSRSFSEEVDKMIDQEVKKLVDDCYTDAKRILEENMEILHSCANLLIEKERINREEFEALFKNNEGK